LYLFLDKEQRKKGKKHPKLNEPMSTKRRGVRKEMRKLKQQAARHCGIRKKKTLLGNFV